MAIIKSPNEQYTGVSASVFFTNGQGQTNNPKLIDWFKSKGYTVIEDDPLDDLKAESDKNVNDAKEEQEAETEQESEQTDDKEDLSEFTNDEIKARLDAKGIEYKTKDTKDTLIELLGE